MTETLLLPESDVLSPEATDESLIQAARQLNASYNGHLKRSIEDFWRLGQTLSRLFQRRHLEGRWADILSDIGINVTTDNHARRLFQATTLDGLSEFKNKTQALRFFGILSTPAPNQPRGSTPGVKGREKPESPPDRSAKLPTSTPTTKAAPAADKEADNNAEAGDDSDLPTAGHRPTTSPAPDDSLKVLAMVATRLEMLVSDRITVTADHLAQIDRAMAALDRLRAKGVAHAA